MPTRVICTLIAVLLLWGCGKEEKPSENPLAAPDLNQDKEEQSSKNPLTASDLDQDKLGDVFDQVDIDYTTCDPVFWGFINNGDVKESELEGDDCTHIYEFGLSATRPVTITLDGKEDIAWYIISVLDSGKNFELLKRNDEDDVSPISSYKDRSKGVVSLDTGQYFLACVSRDGVYPRRGNEYRLEIIW